MWNKRPPTIADGLYVGQGIPNHIDAPSEQYDGIAHMICAALAKGQPRQVCVNMSWCKTGSPRNICGQFRP